MSCVPSSVRELSLFASMKDIALARLECASTDVCRKLASAGSAACTPPRGVANSSISSVARAPNNMGRPAHRQCLCWRHVQTAQAQLDY